MDEHRPLIAGIIVVKRMGKLVGDVSVQGAAQGYVECLAAAADAEEGFSVRGSSLKELYFDCVPFKVHVIDSGMGGAVEKIEGNVPTS
jgi:hypothetical protein